MPLPVKTFFEWYIVRLLVGCDSGFPLGIHYMAIRLVALDINCGFARSAIWELKKGPNKQIDKEKRASEFKELSVQCPNESCFESSGGNSSLFDRDCEKIESHFSGRWKPKESRVEYQQVFSSKHWKALPQHNNEEHTLAKCKPCCDDHFSLQTKLPQGPYFEPTINTDEIKQLGNCDRICEKGPTSRISSKFS